MKSHRSVLLVLLVSAALPGCSLWSTVTGKERRAQEQAQRVDEIQNLCQRFADRFAGVVLESVAPVAASTRDPRLVGTLKYWELTQLNSAYTIATGPNPVACPLDFVVLTTLSRMVVEDTLVELDSELMRSLPAVYRDLEDEAWRNAGKILTSAQLAEVRQLIADWRSKNPQVTLVGFVHFAEFARAAGWSSEQRGTTSSSILSMVGLDPLAGLDPAVRQIEQTRLLAERMIFYMQRVPYLLDVQTDRVVSQATLAPEIQRLNASLERSSLALAEYARIGADLPLNIAREREALIQQLSGEMLQQEAELRGVLAEMQTTLVSGSDAAVAIEGAVTALDRLMAHFPKRDPGDPTAPGKPFDITEYTAAAAGFTGAARELTHLIETLERGGVPMGAAIKGTVTASRDLLNHLFWLALLLGVLLIAAGLAAALTYRRIARRAPA